MVKRAAVSGLSEAEVPQQVSEMQALMDKSRYLDNASVGINVLLGGSKEELWPVYATFCSCGDSTNPGKLSGPNLFTLLSKLGILNNRIALSDIGMLLHQISAHLHAQAPASVGAFSPASLDGPDCPSLSFEEFLVFLCAYSQQFYDSPSHPGSDSGDTETLSTLSHDPGSLRREAIRLMAVGSKTSPSMSVKPTRHRGSSTTSDLDTCSSPVYGRDISVTETRPFVSASNQANQEYRSHGLSTGLNIIISSDSGVEGGCPSASRAWFSGWRDHMNSSVAFKDLLETKVLPTLRGHTILATPDDARLRDKYAVLYSLEVLLTMQRVEDTLRSIFMGEIESGSIASPDSVRSARSRDSALPGAGALTSRVLVHALRRINMVPQVISEVEILRLIGDVVPEVERGASCSKRRSSPSQLHPTSPIQTPLADSRSPRMDSPNAKYCEGEKDYNGELLFSHLEWVVCMVAFEAMHSALRLSATPTNPEVTVNRHYHYTYLFSQRIFLALMFYYALLVAIIYSL